MLDRAPSERGSAAVEFALLLPILLLLLLALVQVGVIARDALVLTQASTEEVQEAVRAAAVGLDPGRMRVDVAWAGAQGSPVTVSLAYDVPIAALLAGWLFPDSIELAATATMRQEFA